MTPRLTHLALHVRDLAASIAFYQEYCGLLICQERGEGRDQVVWLAEPGREREFIFVFIPGGPERAQAPEDYSHFGFACGSRDEVDETAARAKRAGFLVWPPREEPYPVGYYCGVRDPDGNFIEFSFGQPLGPGAVNPDGPSSINL